MTATSVQQDSSQDGLIAWMSPAAEILARARAVAPLLRERAAEIEQERRLPADVVEMLRSTGVFRMGFSRSWGGQSSPL